MEAQKGKFKKDNIGGWKLRMKSLKRTMSASCELGKLEKETPGNIGWV